MIVSMTGFGQVKDKAHSFSIEIRCLNARFLDMSLRLPDRLSGKEYEIRKKIADALVRGKVSVNVEMDRSMAVDVEQTTAVFEKHYQKLAGLADKVGADKNSIFQIALAKAEEQRSEQGEVPDELWTNFKECLHQALLQCQEFRRSEGAAMETKIRESNSSIGENLGLVEALDKGRQAKARKRIQKAITDLMSNEKLDENRLEQEIIFYIEKLDISEECVRLHAHLTYFEEVMNSTKANGKKLGFIAQEIGREVNTIGAKANDAQIQGHVVVMKEELEKIKEQLQNIC